MPVVMILLFFKIVAASLLNLTSHPSSHNCPTEIKFALVNPGRTRASVAGDDNDLRGMLPCCFAVVVLPFGKCTFGPLVMLCKLVRIEASVGLMYVFDAPLSSFAVTEFFTTSAYDLGILGGSTADE